MRGHSHLEMPLVRPRVGCSFSVLVTQNFSLRLSFILFMWSWEACSFVFKYASVCAYVCCGDQMKTSGVIPQEPLTLLFEIGSLISTSISLGALLHLLS